ncbi:MAG: diphthamide biosynthesis enzyme Dph2 [Methanobacteriaceae archaeon]|jgi:2-(3-amino-3-carboxypropyl)histidine synthase|nr:MAG: diphthamide biosynthesis enzyme Dph2 [Methanobacterium sp. BRmetb2]MCC7557973.1 diphthamide biosynthesis enzyme Dph2 [Methanobacteriaceae archaeon]
MFNYDFKMEEIIEKIKELKAKKVALQFPEGLKIYATTIAEEIENKTNTKVIISGDACYGACDVVDKDMGGIVDLIVHFGHTPLPLDYKIPVLFVEANSLIKVEDTMKKSLKDLDGYDKIGLVTTTQHLNRLEEMKTFLEDNGKKVFLKKGVGTSEGQVLGCNFSSIKDLPVDAFLYVGGGNFHPLGIKLFTGRPVIIADPYMGDVRSIDEFSDKILRVRFAKIVKAGDSDKFGIIVSSKEGQFRLELACRLKEMIQSSGKSAEIIMMDSISPTLLMAYRDVDAFVITACPRIAIDDSNMYEKPLITPQELEIVLDKRDWSDYEMDEIKYDENENMINSI